jgi:type I restriction enzyme R subunit
MKGHNMIQAISRVNRVFRDKPAGLIVDYIGIGDDLREATNRYTQGGGEGTPAPNIDDEAKPLFFAKIDEVRHLVPPKIDYGDWRKLSKIDLEDRYTLVYGHLTESDDARDQFLQVEHRLTMSFTLVKHLDDIRPFANEVIFFQRVRNQLLKTLPGSRPARSLEDAIKDIVDDAVDSEGVVDIFQSAGVERADISILDDNFLQTFKDKPHVNLRLKLLEKLLGDEIQRRQRKNLAKAQSFRALLEETLRRYHNRLIDAAAVIKTMVEMRRDWEESDTRAAALGLSEEELAFYDSVAANYQQIYGQDFLRDLIHDVVQTIKRNLKVEWTAPHRDDVKAAVRSAVRRVLRRRNVKPEDFDQFLKFIMEQAEALYADWPMAA